MALNVTGVIPRPDLGIAVQQEGLAPDGYVAHKVFPVMRVGVSTAPIPGFLRRREVFRVAKPKHGGYQRVQQSATQFATYNCVDQGLEEPLDQKDIEILGGIAEAERVTAIGLREDVLRARDATLAATLFSTTTFGAGFNAAFTTAVGAAGSKVIDNFSDAIERVRIGCGFQANKALISGGMFAKMRKDPQIQAQYRAIAGFTDKTAGVGLMLQEQAIAQVLGVDELVIGYGIRDNADEGQTRSKSSVWADTFALLYYQPDVRDYSAPFLGRTFIHDADQADNGISAEMDPMTGLMYETYAEPQNNVQIMRARHFSDMLLLNRDSAQLLTGG